MENAVIDGSRSNPGQGPKFCVNTEGTEHSWPTDTITTEEIAELGGWDPAVGVLEVDRDNNERTLEPGEVVELRPGQAFCRKVRFKRGLAPDERAEQECQFLADYFPEIERRNTWFRIPAFPVPTEWGRSRIEIAFGLSEGYPGTPPYGIYVPAGIRVCDKAPSNYVEPAKNQPPFAGKWGVFSWAPDDWGGAVEPVVGWSLLAFVRSFGVRFQELN